MLNLMRQSVTNNEQEIELMTWQSLLTEEKQCAMEEPGRIAEATISPMYYGEHKAEKEQSEEDHRRF